MPLKPDDLAQAMLNALGPAWREVKGGQLPSGGEKDQKVLFIAIARGLLTYLHENPKEIMDKINLTDPPTGFSHTYNVGEVDLKVDLT